MKRAYSLVGGLLFLIIATSTALAQTQQVEKENILNAIKAAFKTWELPCTSIKFNYKGEMDEKTFFAGKTMDNAIVVYFGHDTGTWVSGDLAYTTEVNIQTDAEADIITAVIGMNAKDWAWSLDAAKNKIDIQSAVTQLIPTALGFYVGPDPVGAGQVNLAFNALDRDLQSSHKEGATYGYFKNDANCTQPAMPFLCGSDYPQTGADAGVPTDAGTDAATALEKYLLCIFHSRPDDLQKGKHYHWTKSPIDFYVYIPNAGQLPGLPDVLPGNDAGTDGSDPGTDGGVLTDSGNDSSSDGGTKCTKSTDCKSNEICSTEGTCVKTDGDGCCSVGTTSKINLLYAGLMLISFIAFRRLQRQRGRSE